ncbi:12645_t:CDS:10, partial [Entrophospora sp. SA101]
EDENENDHNSNDPLFSLTNSSFCNNPNSSSKSNIDPNEINKLLKIKKSRNNRKRLVRKNSNSDNKYTKNVVNTPRPRSNNNSIVIKDDNICDDISIVANCKKNKEFHNYFNSLPDTELLINEILAHGRIYVSKNYICFCANIFGWVTNEIISMSEIASIEKKMSAFVIPNAILITTKDSKEYFFTSFLSRDSVYDLLVSLCKIENKEKMDLEENNLGDGCGKKEGTTTIVGSENECSDIEKRKSLTKNISSKLKNLSNRKRETIAASSSIPTRSISGPESGEFSMLDTEFPGTIEEIYNLLFTSNFFSDFITNHENNDDTNIGEWVEEDGKRVRFGSYTKKFPNSFKIGPKTTKVHLKDELVHCDFTGYTTLLTSTSTPDVPSGDSFVVMTKTCLMYAGRNRVRIIVSCAVNFTKNCWLKGTIEKASIVGQSTKSNSSILTSPILVIISKLSSLLSIFSTSSMSPPSNLSPQCSMPIPTPFTPPPSIFMPKKTKFKPETIIFAELLVTLIGYFILPLPRTSSLKNRLLDEIDFLDDDNNTTNGITSHKLNQQTIIQNNFFSACHQSSPASDIYALVKGNQNQLSLNINNTDNISNDDSIVEDSKIIVPAQHHQQPIESINNDNDISIITLLKPPNQVPRKGHTRKRSLSAPTIPSEIQDIPIQRNPKNLTQSSKPPMSSEEYRHKLNEELEKVDFNDITVSELKNLLRQRNKPATGKKAILMQRLQEEVTLFNNNYGFINHQISNKNSLSSMDDGNDDSQMMMSNDPNDPTSPVSTASLLLNDNLGYFTTPYTFTQQVEDIVMVGGGNNQEENKGDHQEDNQEENEEDYEEDNQEENGEKDENSGTKALQHQKIHQKS